MQMTAYEPAWAKFERLRGVVAAVTDLHERTCGCASGEFACGYRDALDTTPPTDSRPLS